MSKLDESKGDLNSKKIDKSFPIAKRKIFSKTSYAVVQYWHYKKQNFGHMSNIRNYDFLKKAFDVESGAIDSAIASVTVNKAISAPSGTFEIRLHPTENWKKVLAPGDWIAIHFYNVYSDDAASLSKSKPSTKNLVMLGNIDRIARTIEKDEETDKARLTYVVSGRNFGKAFEETDIWYDPFATQVDVNDSQLRKAGLVLTGNPTDLVQNLLKIFMGPGVNDGRLTTKPLLQWRIPKEVAAMFGATAHATPNKPVVYDIVKRLIDDNLPGFKENQMIDINSNGSVWDNISRAANTLVNEVFLEEVRFSDGTVKPSFVLRPRPLQTPMWGETDKDSQFGKEDKAIRKYLKGAHQTMQNLATKSFIEISPAEIKYENLGRDEHSRFNQFYMKTTEEYEKNLSTVADANKKNAIGNPVFVRESIQRHGLKRFDQVLEFCKVEGEKKVEEAGVNRNVNLWKAFMVQLYDMHYANHLYESGTIETSGILEAELGSILKIPPDAGTSGPTKIYYIEGYTHTWRFPSSWSTTFTVTHGQFHDPEKPFIDVTGEGDMGQADQNVDSVYLSKTNTRKK